MDNHDRTTADPPTPVTLEHMRAFGPRAKWLLIGLTVILIGLGLLLPRSPEPRAGAGKQNDLVLYQTIIEAMRGGQGYYQAATEAQRARGYPLRPFLAVRPPTLAVAMSALPNAGAGRLAMGGLGVITVLAFLWRVTRQFGRPIAIIIAFASGIAAAFVPDAYLTHEIWAGLFIALSLAIHTPRSWLLSLVFGLIAVSVRELAAPYLLVMAVLGWRDGRRAECVCWVLGLAACGVGLWLHGAAVASLVRPGDSVSPGWLALGGWPFVLAALHMNGIAFMAPHWLLACLAPLALLGLATWTGPLCDRIALTVIGYCCAFLFVGRADNLYWGLLIAPLWPLGLPAAWVFAMRLRRRAPTAA